VKRDGGWAESEGEKVQGTRFKEIAGWNGEAFVGFVGFVEFIGFVGFVEFVECKGS
jgi:hypothetical protein